MLQARRGFSATGWGAAGSTEVLGYGVGCSRLDGSSWLQLGLLVAGARSQACSGLYAAFRLQMRPWLQMGVWLQVGRSPWKPDEGERVCADQMGNDEGQLRVMRPQPDLRSDLCPLLQLVPLRVQLVPLRVRLVAREKPALRFSKPALLFLSIPAPTWAWLSCYRRGSCPRRFPSSHVGMAP